MTEGQLRQLGVKHPDRLKRCVDVLETSTMEEGEGAASPSERGCLRQLGAQDPHMLINMRNLVLMYQDQG